MLDHLYDDWDSWELVAATSDWGGPAIRDILQNHIFSTFQNFGSTNLVPSVDEIADLCSLRAVCVSWNRLLPLIPFVNFDSLSFASGSLSALGQTCFAAGTAKRYTSAHGQDIREAIRSNTTLRDLRIFPSENRAEPLCDVLRGLAGNRTVQSLQIAEFCIDRRVAICLSGMLQDNSVLRQLKLVNNEFGSGGVSAFISAIQRSENLKTLELEGIKPTSEELADLLSELGRAGLLSLCVRNAASVERHTPFHLLLHEESSLTSLDLSRNDLDDSILNAIFGALASNTKLKRLVIQSNTFLLTTFPSKIEFALATNRTLQELDLEASLCFRRNTAKFVQALEANFTLTLVNILCNDVPERLFNQVEAIMTSRPTMKILYK